MEVMKKCKECGKLFKPDNPRQKYCTDQHYGPCPVCGKPTPLKWNGYPASRCDECKRLKLRAGTKAAELMQNAETNDASLPDDFVERKYVGRDGSCGFVKDHKYLIKVKPNRPYGYVVEAIKDLTTNEDLEDVGLPIASPNSFYYFFKEQ